MRACVDRGTSRRVFSESLVVPTTTTASSTSAPTTSTPSIGGNNSHHPQHHVSAFRSKLALVPHDLVVRSLRRRFWTACQQDDAEQAIRLYRASRTDWEQILEDEEMEATPAHHRQRRAIAKHAVIPVLKNQRCGGGGVLWRRKLPSNELSTGHQSPVIAVVKEEQDPISTSPILPHSLQPNDVFEDEDMRHPVFEPYLELAAPSNATDPSSLNHRTHRRWFRPGPLPSSSAEGIGTPPLPQPPSDASSRTTPLHEAARMGSGDLVRCLLLAWTGGVQAHDIDVKNGSGQTPLHAVAGGVTCEEAKPENDQNNISIHSPKSKGRERLHRTGRATLSFGSKSRRDVIQNNRKTQFTKDGMLVSDKRRNELNLRRLDAALALLAVKASTNAVDQHGRTPLHYAAALGRSEMSMAFVNIYGTLLTVVDGYSRSPAECAALQGHGTLSAQLGARALLTMDPHDLDLLDSIQQEHDEQNDPMQGSNGLSPPFAWFTTFSVDRVQREREFRVEVALERMKKILDRLNGGLNAIDFLKSSSSTTNNSKEDCDLSPASSVSPLPSNIDSEAHAMDQDLDPLGNVHEGHVAEFLSQHGWDVKRALAAFYEDPIGSFADAKISLPPTCSDRKVDDQNSNLQATCLICCDEFDTDSDEWRVLSCSHGFCVTCLGDYIADGARSRIFGFTIPCPHHDCSVLLSPAQVSDLTPTAQVQATLTETASNNFVMKAWDFRFCPQTGCNHVVKYVPPKAKSTSKHTSTWITSCAVCCTPESHTKRKEVNPAVTYEGMYNESYFVCHAGVQPERAHRFCFQCGEGAHWPVTCRMLQKWKETVEEQVQEVDGVGADCNDVSQKLWIKANTRPCPKCKAPIEKNDGCNHVTCMNPHCKHEFCWICRKEWNLHGSDTGGFFRCNRWVVETEEHQFYDKPPSPDELQTPTEEDLGDPRRMMTIYGTTMHEKRVASKRSREMARFLHHFQRFGAHADSARLEAQMADSCVERLKPIVHAAIEFSEDSAFNFGGRGLSFVFDAFTELRECRSVLQHSYAFSYFRYDQESNGSRRQRCRISESMSFEKLQADLETITEQMSDLVARAHMRATQYQILYLTLTAAQKRKDFLDFLLRLQEKEKDDPESLEYDSDLSLGSEGQSLDRAASLSSIFQDEATPGEAIVDSGRAGADMDPEHREWASEAALDAAFQASLQAFRERSGALNLLHVNTSFDSNEIEREDDDGEQYRQWSCPTCTFINTSGRLCSMCGRYYSGSLAGSSS